MVITKKVLENLKLKEGKLSEKRCEEINRMKIKNPYSSYPKEFFTSGEYFMAENAQEFVFTDDECIAYTNAFYPYPIIVRESSEYYDDIYILFIDNEWYEIIFDYVGDEDIIKDGFRYCITTKKLRENEKLSNRVDIKEIIFLIEELFWHRYEKKQKYGQYNELNLIYKGEEYKWKNWSA